MVCSLIYFAKELVIQKIRLSVEKRVSERRIKGGVELLTNILITSTKFKETESSGAEVQVLRAFEDEALTTDLAVKLYDGQTSYEDTSSKKIFPHLLWLRYGLSNDSPVERTDFVEAVQRIRRDATDVMRAIEDLNRLCWLVVLVLWAVVAGTQVMM